MKTKKVYTYRKGNEHFICSRQQMIKILSEEIYYDTMNCGWFGIDSANYEKGEQKANWLARTGITLVCENYSFRVYKSEQDFEKYRGSFGKTYIDIR